MIVQLSTGPIDYSTIYLVNTLIVLIFSLCSLLLLIIKLKEQEHQIKFIKFYMVIGLTNLILLILEFIYFNFGSSVGSSFGFTQEVVMLNMILFIILSSIARIFIFGILLIFIGLKNGNSIKMGNHGHLIIISGIFFIIGQFFLINSELSLYLFYVGDSYNYSSVFLYTINGYANLIFTFVGYIYWSKFSSRNEDTFRKVYSILSIIALFLPLLISLLGPFYYNYLLY